MPKKKPTEEQSREHPTQPWTSVFDELAKKRMDKKGHGWKPEPPSMVAKVHKDGGELFLAGLPQEGIKVKRLVDVIGMPSLAGYDGISAPAPGRGYGGRLSGCCTNVCVT